MPDEEYMNAYIVAVSCGPTLLQLGHYTVKMRSIMVGISISSNLLVPFATRRYECCVCLAGISGCKQRCQCQNELYFKGIDDNNNG